MSGPRVSGGGFDLDGPGFEAPDDEGDQSGQAEPWQGAPDEQARGLAAFGLPWRDIAGGWLGSGGCVHDGCSSSGAGSGRAGMVVASSISSGLASVSMAVLPTCWVSQRA